MRRDPVSNKGRRTALQNASIIYEPTQICIGECKEKPDSETSRGPLWKPENRLLAAIRSRPDRLQITLSFRPLISSANPISIGSKHPLPGQ